jgi:pantoate kinase
MPGFSDFLVMLLNDAALRDELLRAPDLATLMARTQELARERGIELAPDELQAVVNQNRRSWLERWTDR